MLLSKTSEYALQALIYLATRPAGELVLSGDIWEYLKDPDDPRVPPRQYLAKILQDLSKSGVLESRKGRGGGFVLAPGAEHKNILDVVEIVERKPLGQGCVLGLKKCADATACPVHYAWQPLKAQVIDLLSQQTIGGMADAVRAGRYRIHLPGGGELRLQASGTGQAPKG